MRIDHDFPPDDYRDLAPSRWDVALILLGGLAGSTLFVVLAVAYP